MTKILTLQASPNSRVVEVPLDTITGAITLEAGRYSEEEIALLVARLAEEGVFDDDAARRLLRELRALL